LKEGVHELGCFNLLTKHFLFNVNLQNYGYCFNGLGVTELLLVLAVAICLVEVFLPQRTNQKLNIIRNVDLETLEFII